MTGVEARVNGNADNKKGGLNLVGETPMEIRVKMPARDSTIAVIVQNRFKESEPAIVRVRWTGQVEQGVDIRSTLYVLAIGVSSYTDKNLKEGVQYAANDARDFVSVMKRQMGGVYKGFQAKLLVNGDAQTRTHILSGFDWVERAATNNDVIMIFLAGHGETDTKNRYYFLPAESDRGNFTSTGLPQTDIVGRIRELPGRVFVFIDTCYAGLLSTRSSGPDIDRIVNEIAEAPKDGVIFASSTGNQRSGQAGENGAFTKALTEGLSGKAAEGGTGKITIGTLGVYIAERVNKLTNGQQKPPLPAPFKGSGLSTDYPLAVKIHD